MTAEWWDTDRNGYDADTEYVRSSDLKDFYDCPTIYRARHLLKPGDHGYMGRKPQSRQMTVGTHIHSAALEGVRDWKTATPCGALKKNGTVCGNDVAAGGMLCDTEEGIFVCGVHARGRNTVAYPDALTPAESDSVEGMVTAIENSDVAQELLSDRFHERAARSVDPETGVKKKSLIDIIKPRPFILGDLKSTSEFNAESIWRKIDQNCWLLSLAHYESVVMDIQAAHGKPVHYPAWVFLIVESIPPYRVTDWPIDGTVQDDARREYRELLAEFSECQRAGVWNQRPINTAAPQWWAYKHNYAHEGSK